jgi:hypothetical protein
MQVHIGVGSTDRSRHVWWRGEVDWPSVPPEGATWVHCGGWSGEQIHRVYWCGPGDDGPDSGVHVEVRAADDVLDHLVEAHGFTEDS